MEKTSYLLAGSGILATKRRIFGRKVIRGGGNALPLERIVEPYHGMIEWPGLKRTTMIVEFQAPCHVQGRQPLERAAQSHIQPGLECLQRWGIHNLLGQPVPVVFTTLWVKNFPLISNLNLPCLSLKPFPLVLSLSTHVNSCSPSCLYAPFKYWKATMRSPQSLLFSKLNKPSSLNLSS